MGGGLAADVKVRFGVDRISYPGEILEKREGFLVPEQRAVVAPGHALGEGLDVGVEPDDDAALQDQRSRFVIDEGATAGRDHPGRPVDQPRDHPPLAVPEAVFAEAVEDFGDAVVRRPFDLLVRIRSEEHTSELQSLMRISYAVFCLKKKKHKL